jgi:fumarate reductase flavoprotein subunit
MPDVDIVIVGGGGAGLAAAVTAADEGASVLVVEAAGDVGGATALAGGSFMAAGTAQQAALGHPDDSADEFYDYYMTFNRWDADPAVVRRFCDRAAPTLRWLEGLGVEFPPGSLYRAGPGWSGRRGATGRPAAASPSSRRSGRPARRGASGSRPETGSTA